MNIKAFAALGLAAALAGCATPSLTRIHSGHEGSVDWHVNRRDDGGLQIAAWGMSRVRTYSGFNRHARIAGCTNGNIPARTTTSRAHPAGLPPVVFVYYEC